jgi:MFS family permease
VTAPVETPKAAERASISVSLGRREWLLLAITLVFWVFDGYETFALLITGFTAVKSLLPVTAAADVPRYFGYVVALTLLGWAAGGVIGGIMGDRFGRRRTMVTAVVVYGVFTGLTAFVPNWELLGATRFLTGLGIGAEWGVGIALLQEVWPAEWRTKGAGLLQAGFSMGGLLASALWILFGTYLGLSWRLMFLVGIVPAFLVFAAQPAIPESERWLAKRTTSVRTILSGLLTGTERRNLVLGVIASIAITVGFWGASSYLPSFVGSLAAPKDASFYSGFAGALYNGGEIVGCILFGFAAEWFNRRSTAVVYLLGSLIVLPIVYLTTRDAMTASLMQLAAGLFTGGVFSWYAVHPPELFSTAARSSSISIIFNLSRLLAVVGAVVTGTMAQALGGVGHAAAAIAPIYLLGIVAVLLLPETKGQPLPD